MSSPPVVADWQYDGTVALTADEAASAESVTDLVHLSTLTANTILHAMRHRFHQHHIYTNVHQILLALNPYQLLPRLYDSQSLSAYSTRVPVADRSSLAPHVFAVARDAYERATGSGAGATMRPSSQSILISGESGAGKTETTKYLLSYIAAASGSDSGVASPRGPSAIEAKLLLANPILESLGNARTTRNDNSSRFGKWIEIQTNQTGRPGIAGARLIKYLLEESRVVGRGKDERSFNIFYQLLAADRQADSTSPKPEEFAYLRQSGCYTVDGSNDGEVFRGVVASLNALGMPAGEQKELFDILRAILYMGEIAFEVGAGSDHAQVKQGDSSEKALAIVAGYFGLPVDTLRTALCVKVIVSGRQSMIRVERNVAQAQETRDSISKCMYGKLFEFVIDFLNGSLKGHATSFTTASSSSSSSPSSAPVTIGILDIFGFEIFDQNGFEQLCINAANERLHQHFLASMFKMEQQMLVDEGIRLPANYAEIVSFQDNVLCLELIEQKPHGIFALLNDELAIPRGTDLGFVQKMHRRHADEAKHKHYVRPRQTAASTAAAAAAAAASKASGSSSGDLQFTGGPSDPDLDFRILHFADAVTYNGERFLDKNRSKLNEELLATFQQSTNDTVRAIFAEPMPAAAETEATEEEDVSGATTRRRGTTISPPPVDLNSTSTMPQRRATSVSISSSMGSSKPTSLASQFHQSLTSLLSSINSTSSSFIRCIKPNTTRSSIVFDSELVYQQMRNNGMMDVVKQRQEQVKREREGQGGGYSERVPLKQFVEKFRVLALKENVMPTTKRKLLANGKHTPLPRVALASAGAGALSASAAAVLKVLAPYAPATTGVGALPPYQIGKTRVFLTQACLSAFDAALLALRTAAAIKAEKVVRGFLVRRRWRHVLQASFDLTKALKGEDLNALDEAVAKARTAGLDPKRILAVEGARGALVQLAEAKATVNEALNGKAASLADRLSKVKAGLDAAIAAHLVDAAGTILPREKPTHAMALLQKQASFLCRYDAIVRQQAEELQQLAQSVSMDHTTLAPLAAFLSKLDSTLDPILVAGAPLSPLGLQSKEALAGLRGLSASDEAVKAAARQKQLSSLLRSFESAQKSNDQSKQTECAIEAESLGCTWPMMRAARFETRAKDLETEVAEAIHALVPNLLKGTAAMLTITLEDAAAVAGLNKCFSSPAISVQSLLVSVESALRQVKAETAAEEQLKVAMKKGNLEAIQLAVVVAEQTIKAREETYLSPTTPALGASNGLPNYAARHTKTGGLDALLTGAYVEHARLKRIHDASQALKDLGVELDDEARIRLVLKEAIDAGVPTGETEIVGRRLREVETRLALQRAMDAKDIAGLDSAIADADQRLANNEMEVLTNRFQDTLNAAKHSVALLRSLQALQAKAEALRRAHANAPPGIAGARTADIVHSEAEFKHAYSDALMLGARDDDLFLVEDLHQPLRKDPREMTEEELLTERDLQHQRTQAHYEAVRRKAKVDADAQMAHQKQVRAAATGAPPIPARPTTRPGTREPSPARADPAQVKLEERRPSTAASGTTVAASAAPSATKKKLDRPSSSASTGSSRPASQPAVVGSAKTLGEMFKLKPMPSKPIHQTYDPATASLVPEKAAAVPTKATPSRPGSRPGSKPSSRRPSNENLPAGGSGHSTPKPGHGSRRNSREPLAGDSVAGWQNHRTPRGGAEAFNAGPDETAATPTRAPAFVIKGEKTPTGAPAGDKWSVNLADMEATQKGDDRREIPEAPAKKRATEQEPAPVKACCAIQ